MVDGTALTERLLMTFVKEECRAEAAEFLAIYRREVEAVLRHQLREEAS